MHGLGENVFAKHRAKRCAAVAAAGEGRRPGSLQLDVAADAVAVDHFADENRPPVAELRHEGTELVAGIGHGKRSSTLRHDIAGEDRRQPLRVRQVRLKAELPGQRLVEFQEHRSLDRLGVDRGIETLGQARIGIVELKQGQAPSPLSPFNMGIAARPANRGTR